VWSSSKGLDSHKFEAGTVWQSASVHLSVVCSCSTIRLQQQQRPAAGVYSPVIVGWCRYKRKEYVSCVNTLWWGVGCCQGLPHPGVWVYGGSVTVAIAWGNRQVPLR